MNKFVRTILMTGFDVDDEIFRTYTKKKIINGFVQKPVRLYDLTRGYANTLLGNAKDIRLPVIDEMGMQDVCITVIIKERIICQMCTMEGPIVIFLIAIVTGLKNRK